MKQVRYVWTIKFTGATGHGEWLDATDQIVGAPERQREMDKERLYLGSIEYREKP